MIGREAVEDALENDRCGICGSVDHFREDHPAVDVDALAKLRETATPGPWEHNENWTRWADDGDGQPVVETQRPDDAALIVAAVNNLEPLLAEVRRGRALRERLEGLAGRLDGLAAHHAQQSTEAPSRYRHYQHDGLSCAYGAVTDDLRALLAAVDAS